MTVYVADMGSQRPTPDRLREVMSYDTDSGLLTWKVRRGPQSAGKTVGYRRKDGYLHVGVDGWMFLGHVVAWTIVNGRWPNGEIDHENLNKSDDRFGNLREASDQQNAANRPKRSDSKQPYKGISRTRDKWRAAVTIDGKRKYFGYCDTPEEAAAIYIQKQIELHGEFARSA